MKAATVQHQVDQNTRPRVDFAVNWPHSCRHQSQQKGPEQMWRSLLPIGALVGLTACGDGNPFVPEPETSTNAGVTVNASEFSEDLSGDSVVFNDNNTATPNDDTLTINNIPFDSSDTTGGEYTFRNTLPNGFGVYESPSTGSASGISYFAVFRQTDNAQVTSVGTNGFVQFGFGGVIAERLVEAGLPAARPETYRFTGEYAGIRIGRSDSSQTINTVTGTALLDVDILDLDGTGAITGVVGNRSIFNLQGVLQGTAEDFISLGTTSVDTADATINPGSATSVENGISQATGQWSGLFAGPNGEEIAGVLVVEGSATTNEEAALGTGATIREQGAFIVVNTNP